MPLTIDVYHSEHCGSYYTLRENIDRALAELGISVAVAYHIITYDDAVSRNIHGSPSIWINGRDAFTVEGDPGIF